MRVLAAILVCSAAFSQGVKTPATLGALQAQATEAREQNRSTEAVILYREALRMQPAWSEGWWYLGTLLYDQNSFAPARDALLKLVQLEPKSPPPAWGLLGLCEFETKNYPDALRHLERSFVNEAKDDPFARATRYHSAMLLSKSGQFEAALNRLAQISAPDTETPELIQAIGVAGLRQPVLATELPAAQHDLADAVGHAIFDGSLRREKEAEARYVALIAQYPKRAELHYLHGVALLKGDTVAAVSEFKKEIEISPRHVPARLQIAFEYLSEGEPAQALPFARQAVALEPGSFVAHNAAGQALIDSGDLKGGIAELEKARALAPDSPETHLKLASAYAQAGRDQDAARERETFAKLRNMVHSAATPQQR